MRSCSCDRPVDYHGGFPLSVSSGRLGPRSRRRGAGDGDQAVLRALHLRYRGPLYGYARRALGDHGAAEELVQDVLLRAWQHGHGVDRLEELGPWLYTVARNLVIDRHRRTRARPVTRGEDTERVGHHDEWVEVTELLSRWELMEALRRLSAAHRDIIVEVYYRDATIATVAARFGIAEGTVKSRLHYGLVSLRDILEQMGTTT